MKQPLSLFGLLVWRLWTRYTAIIQRAVATHQAGWAT